MHLISHTTTITTYCNYHINSDSYSHNNDHNISHNNNYRCLSRSSLQVRFGAIQRYEHYNHIKHQHHEDYMRNTDILKTR